MSQWRSMEDFMDDGMSYEDAVAAYNAQVPPRRSSSWFTDTMSTSSDPDVERALRAQQEWIQSQQSLFGRYTPQQLQSLGLSPLGGSPYGATPYGSSPYV